MYQTKIKSYAGEKAMNRGIKRMQTRGWTVENTTVDSQGYGCAKTAFLGCLFLPLALLGKKPNRYLVEFRK